MISGRIEVFNFLNSSQHLKRNLATIPKRFTGDGLNISVLRSFKKQIDKWKIEHQIVSTISLFHAVKSFNALLHFFRMKKSANKICMSLDKNNFHHTRHIFLSVFIANILLLGI